jgi:beta-glucosidase
VTVDVRNSGGVDGEEVVQMYVSHLDSSVLRPQEELKGFKRVAIGAGETATVAIPLKASTLAYWDGNGLKVENDSVEVRVGGSSESIELRTQIKVGK